MKVIIFGCGNIYHKRKREIPKDVRVLGIIDNNEALHGKLVDGIGVFSPWKAKNFDYDYIVLMSDSAVQMREQLLQMGYLPEKLLHYSDFFGLFPHEIKKYSAVGERGQAGQKALLIISVPLVFNGVPIVSLTTAKVAMQLGYSVTIAAESGDDRYIAEATREGIDVLICKEIGCLLLENLSWTDEYDVILVNSIPMIRLAVKLSKKRRISMWIHENLENYQCVKFWEREIVDGVQNEAMRIYAPSKRARKNFFHYYPLKKEIRLLGLGIEDKRNGIGLSHGGIFYGIAGGIEIRKGQDIFLSAVEELPQGVLDEAFFLLIGRKSIGKFGEEIAKRSSLINNCILLGERTQQEMRELYEMLDILVVASREETVSMVAVEAMMMGKVCIVSDQTGIEEYIEHGQNGFVFQSENIEELKALMLWCYQHQGQLGKIGENARKTYERNFSMKLFANRLQDVLEYKDETC